MPYFTRQVAQNGSLMVVAFIGVSQPRLIALQAAKQPVPKPVQVQAMIDTGASCVSVDPTVLQQLSLTPTGTTSVFTPSTGAQPATLNQYDIGLMIPSTANHPALIHATIPVIECELLAAQGFHVLIGRDVLSRCLLTYDGQSGLFSLAY